ncbi:ATP-dependent DNA helicase Q-like 4A-like [Dorcoceras hygrometricum]|uniref:ATP-dependent DNA helicase Q-like 4A-like n=1 Tax=Dorcoceras hygrometricum TaxID=472368 RepID=A0A2Z7AME6_9LAMI|nr:ATP-dependent DNA helicase Q-like 4A-like [Dorcoceras hygrometricum]
MRIRPPELESSICDVKYHVSLAPPPSTSRTAAHRRGSTAPPPSVCRVIGLVSITATRSFRPCQNPSDLLVQIDGGILIPVVDLIRRIYRRLQFKSQFPCDSGLSQAPRRQQGHLSGTCAWLQPVFQEPGASRLIAVDSSIRSTTRLEAPSSDCTRSPDEISTIGFSTKN